jgi:hypothetical protein
MMQRWQMFAPPPPPPHTFPRPHGVLVLRKTEIDRLRIYGDIHLFRILFCSSNRIQLIANRMHWIFKIFNVKASCFWDML